MRFFVGLHQPSDAHRFSRCMVSYARLRERKSDFAPNVWILDSGAFSEIVTHGQYRDEPDVYAQAARRWARCGDLEAVVTQDWMCEPLILARTGLSIREHQTLTIRRFDALRALLPVWLYVLPVLQGYLPEQYVSHLADYGDRLARGAWVGVGSICKRNASPREIAAVLGTIKRARPDLRLHGFGVKLTALESPEVRACLYTADSMAWSYSARRQGRDGNSWLEAERFARRVELDSTTRQRRAPLFTAFDGHGDQGTRESVNTD